MSERFVYLDNAATTRVLPEVAEAMREALSDTFGNPSSLHQAGRTARQLVEDARSVFADHLGVHPRSCVFTSGGTESDNLAVIGSARALAERGRHIVTSNIEHEAVESACELLEEEGYEVTRVPIQPNGCVDAEEFVGAFRDDTILATLMLANNELGTIQPVAEVGAIARERGIRMHTDAVQALGKIDLNIATLNVDLLSISAHKIHGPKGVGMLYIDRELELNARQVGGGQEFKRRSGTENVAGIAGFARAFELWQGDSDAGTRLNGLRDYLQAGILQAFPDAVVHGGDVDRIPNVLNIGIPWVEGESMILGLDATGICISSGSACASSSTEISHVLRALQLPIEVAKGSIRLSVGRETTPDEVEYALAEIEKLVKRLRSLSPIGRSSEEI